MPNTIQKIIIDKQEFILRNAIDEDFEFIFSLLKDNMLESFNRNWGSWNDKSFKENYHKEHIRIIEYQNVNIGYVDFKFKIDCGYLNSIQLSKKFQNRGIGTYIMKLLEEETLNKNLLRICLKVFKDNLAVKLYQKLGYKPISEDTSSFIMEKVI